LCCNSSTVFTYGGCLFIDNEWAIGTSHANLFRCCFNGDAYVKRGRNRWQWKWKWLSLLWSVILRQEQKIYVANAGDSRSFVVAYRPSTGKVQIVYMSREDKPSLPDERARVEAMGGQVYIPMRGTSRVVYHDPITGSPSGLAMSRSIGDWAAGKLGVIPDPIVDVLEIPDLVQATLKNSTANKEQCYVVDENGDMDTGACGDRAEEEEDEENQKDDVYLFGVTATDGLMDYLAAQEIAKVVATSLFEKGASHPITACELLIFSAANGWQQDKQGRYRDDIAIAVSALRLPSAKDDDADDSATDDGEQEKDA